jgi:hypothetical protein
MSILTYRDPDVWKQGMELVEESYKLTGSFPRSELFGLTSQIRRAAVSIPGNVAEGQCRRVRLGFLSRAECTRMMMRCDSVGRLLSGLHRALKRRLERTKGESHP